MLERNRHYLGRTGKCLLFENDRVRCKAENVYEGIDYTRELKITENSVLDYFQVEGKTGVYDYTFHFEPGIELSCDLPTEAADLGFSGERLSARSGNQES